MFEPPDQVADPFETVSGWLREVGFTSPERKPWNDGQDLYLTRVPDTEE